MRLDLVANVLLLGFYCTALSIRYYVIGLIVITVLSELLGTVHGNCGYSTVLYLYPCLGC